MFFTWDLLTLTYFWVLFPLLSFIHLTVLLNYVSVFSIFALNLNFSPEPQACIFNSLISISNWSCLKLHSWIFLSFFFFKSDLAYFLGKWSLHFIHPFGRWVCSALTLQNGYCSVGQISPEGTTGIGLTLHFLPGICFLHCLGKSGLIIMLQFWCHPHYSATYINASFAPRAGYKAEAVYVTQAFGP